MRAFILCAGLGTRLAPITEVIPKPALPLFGIPLVRWTLFHLAAQGVDSAVINTHHLPQAMEQAAREAAEICHVSLTVSHEPVVQGTGGALREAAGLLPRDETFILWNGDILAELDLAGALAAHRQSGAAATMVLRPMPIGERYGAVELDARSSVRRIAGHGLGGDGLVPWHFSGIHLVEPRVLAAVPPSGPQDINRVVYPSLIAQGDTVFGHVVRDGYWSDLGTPSRVIQTHADLMNGALDFRRFPGANPLSPPSRNGIWRHLDAQVAPGAHVVGPSWLGPNARLGASARVGPNAAVNGAVEGSIWDAVLLEGAVAQGEELTGQVKLGRLMAGGT